MKSSSPLSFLAMIARVAWGGGAVSQLSSHKTQTRRLDGQILTQGQA